MNIKKILHDKKKVKQHSNPFISSDPGIAFISIFLACLRILKNWFVVIMIMPFITSYDPLFGPLIWLDLGKKFVYANIR